MAGIGKNLQFRTFDPTVKELGILYRRQFILVPAEDKGGKIDFLHLIHEVESITGQEVTIENLGSTSHQLFNTPLDQLRWSLSRVGKPDDLSNRLFKIDS